MSGDHFYTLPTNTFERQCSYRCVVGSAGTYGIGGEVCVCGASFENFAVNKFHTGPGTAWCL